jgi:hypothetical protein
VDLEDEILLIFEPDICLIRGHGIIGGGAFQKSDLKMNLSVCMIFI